MEFVFNTKSSHSLVYNGYIYLKAKKNQAGSIRWVCQNMRKKGAVSCNISCTALNGTFQRHSRMLYLNSDGSLIHEPHTIGKIKILEFFDGFKDSASSSTHPLMQTEKSVSSYVENN